MPHPKRNVRKEADGEDEWVLLEALASELGMTLGQTIVWVRRQGSVLFTVPHTNRADTWYRSSARRRRSDNAGRYNLTQARKLWEIEKTM